MIPNVVVVPLCLLLIAYFEEVTAGLVVKEAILTKKTKCDDLILTRKDFVLNLEKRSSIDGLKVWWPSKGSCVDLTKKSDDEICGEGGYTTINKNIEVMCVCKEGYVVIKDKEGCHSYYDRGPCAEGEVVTLDAKLMKPICSKDLCAEDNGKYKHHRYAPRENGTCLRLESEDPCPSYIFSDFRDAIKPKPLNCEMEAHELVPTVFTQPPRCVFSEEHTRCRIPVSIEDGGDISKFNEELRKEFLAE